MLKATPAAAEIWQMKPKDQAGGGHKTIESTKQRGKNKLYVAF